MQKDIMFNIQGFYKIKPIVNCSLHKEKIKKYLLSQICKRYSYFVARRH